MLGSRAQGNKAARGSRCFVVCEGKRVVGFYALAAGSVRRTHAHGALRRNMPDPIAAVVLGRLAVDRAWQRQGLARTCCTMRFPALCAPRAKSAHGFYCATPLTNERACFIPTTDSWSLPSTRSP